MKILGIDGGGTKTAWCLFSSADGALRETRKGMLGGSNIRLCSDAELILLFRSMPADADRVGVYLAGCVSEKDRSRLENLSRLVWPGAGRVVGSDRESSMAAALGSREDGIVVICGTGSSVTGRNGEQIERVGGWGHLLGDRGGGYNLAVRGLRLVLRSFDLEQRLTSLAQTVLRELALENLPALVSWAQAADKMEIASLAPVFFRAAEEGDEQMRELLRDGACVLAQYAASVGRRLGLADPAIRLMGGIFRNQAMYRLYFREAIERELPHARIELAVKRAVEGAAVLAMEARPECCSEIASATATELSHAITEQRNPRSFDLDRLSAREFVALFVREERYVQQALAEASPALIEAVTLVGDAMADGGRLFYFGAGTSGRLGVVDASEIPPTFRAAPELVQGVLAGGDEAMFRAVEGVEDDRDAGAHAVQARGVRDADVVCGIAASGRTPFVLGALGQARAVGARTIFLTCNPNRDTGTAVADVEIDLAVGPELLTGSTRLKSGTVTKVVLNMLSTGAMIRLGKVRGNMMIDVHPTNEKLRDRATRIVMSLTGMGYDAAAQQLELCSWNVRDAVDRVRK